MQVTVPRVTIREKLLKLRKSGAEFSRDKEVIYSFCEYFAERVGTEGNISPAGFLACIHQAIGDLQIGMNQRNNELIKNDLANLPPRNYQPFLDVTPEIAWLTCPEEFGNEVCQHRLRTRIQFGREMRQKGITDYIEAEHILGLHRYL